MTGANSGIGFEAATGAGAGRRARGARPAQHRQGEQAAAALSPGGSTGGAGALDLADLASVRAFADAWEGDLDLLVNNAGVMNVPQGTTAARLRDPDRHEPPGHFALTNLLLPHVTRRVVTVSSTAHRMGSIDLDDLNWQRRRYPAAGPPTASPSSPNLLFMLELQARLEALAVRRARDCGAPRLGGDQPAVPQRQPAGRRADAGPSGPASWPSPRRWARCPTLFAATADLPGAAYNGLDGRAEQRGFPTVVGRSAPPPATPKSPRPPLGPLGGPHRRDVPAGGGGGRRARVRRARATLSLIQPDFRRRHDKMDTTAARE